MITQYLLDYINARLRPQSTVVYLDAKHTQKDKPSLSSDYTEGDLLRYSRTGFPREVLKYQVNNTNSMEPWIDAGDVVLVKRLGSAALVTGQVYVYRKSLEGVERLVIHRLVEQRGDNLYFQGDNNFFRDPWVVLRGDVVGLVFGVLWGKKNKD